MYLKLRKSNERIICSEQRGGRHSVVVWEVFLVLLCRITSFLSYTIAVEENSSLDLV